MKFKVWIPEATEFRTNGYYIDSTGKLYFNATNEYRLIRCNDSRFIICFFTGLTDEDDIEVYENDIIKTSNSNVPQLIKITNSSFTSYGHDESYSYLFNGHRIYDSGLNVKFKVIGNKFQNPELFSQVTEYMK